MSTYKITSGTGNIAIQINNEETPTRFQKGEVRYEISPATHRVSVFEKSTKAELYQFALSELRGNTNQSFATPTLADAYLESVFFLNGTS